ncbi:hypothetical protein A2Z22_04590 [Candidatus Woesebacteria bacterium RBG_16_34_12]|uniref:GlcNAc-PI de-N-acetylase n=1 Tax=Candidatus Woesebacteria bacterium RBG_16_34_12 TaxID=1802480 RepID=A0A1F7XBT7_9BACT|nr:MAG: hypothetical protein A2Z22_04590 [Candidatus Woesebacteria bacterium RBG_16_34_12]
MENLTNILEKNKGGKLLAIFPHPDDECFLSGGLFQVAKKYNLKTYLLCLTKGGKGLNALNNGNIKKIRYKELLKSTKLLKINKIFLYDFEDANLRNTIDIWLPEVKKIIKKIHPQIVITFDPSGITGHPDHIVTCIQVLKTFREIAKPSFLLWRVPDRLEIKEFKENKSLSFAQKPNYFLKYSLKQKLTKIKAILSHQSQLKGLKYKILIIIESLINRKEYYFRVDVKRRYKAKYYKYEID